MSRPKLTRPATKQDVFDIVAEHGPAYGLEIADRCAEKGLTLGWLWHGRLYRMLRALEREGLLESYPGETARGRGGRPRRYYRVAGQCWCPCETLGSEPCSYACSCAKPWMNGGCAHKDCPRVYGG